MKEKNNENKSNAIPLGNSGSEMSLVTGFIKSITVEHIFKDPEELKPDELLLEDIVTVETVLMYLRKGKRKKKDEKDFEENLIQKIMEKIYSDEEIAFTEIKAYDKEGVPFVNRFWHNAPDSKYEVKEIVVKTIGEEDKDIYREFTKKEKEENYLLIQKIKIAGVPKEIEKTIKKYSLLEDVVLYNAPVPFRGENWENYKLFKQKFDGIYYGVSYDLESESSDKPYFAEDSFIKNVRAENLLEINKEDILKFLGSTLRRKYYEKEINEIKNDFDKLTRLFLFELRQQIVKNVLKNPELTWSNFDWRVSMDRSNDIRVYDIFNKNGKRVYDFVFGISSNMPIRSWLVKKFSYFLETPTKVSFFERMNGYGKNIALRRLFDYFSLLKKPFGISVPEYKKNRC